MQQGNYGFVKYFQSTRCFNDAHLRKFNKDKISASEIVCFDCALMQMQELATNRIDIPSDQSQQILAIIVRPEIGSVDKVPPGSCPLQKWHKKAVSWGSPHAPDHAL